MRGDHSLDDYQRHLAFLIHAPYARLGPSPDDHWLKNLLFGAKPSDIHLVLPGLTLNDLLPPLNVKPTHQLQIGAHRIVMPLHGRGAPREHKEIISEAIRDSLRIVSSSPEGLVLSIQYPDTSSAVYAPARETLELAVYVQALNGNDERASQIRVIHMNPRGEGHFSVVAPRLVKEIPALSLVEARHLEWADHVE